jgi:hypothetical protein
VPPQNVNDRDGHLGVISGRPTRRRDQAELDPLLVLEQAFTERVSDG